MSVVRDCDGHRIGTQDEFGNIDLDPLYEKHLEDTLEPCRVCGEVLTGDGRTCVRCFASLEYDRLERESGR